MNRSVRFVLSLIALVMVVVSLTGELRAQTLGEITGRRE